jgi:UDP-N-acetylglucosamine 2-epimerase (non-hydrolysing)
MNVFGTRPEIIKMAPVIDACNKYKIEQIIVHTDQHYDKNMSTVFLNELKLSEPDYHLNVGSGTHAYQTAQALTLLEKTISKETPDIVLTQGDTNSTLAAALAAVKLQIPIGHVEAGLRSYDFRMPEEHNRRIVDHISKYLFAPTKKAYNILKNENVWGEIQITGNTVIDSCLKYLPLAEKRSHILEQVEFSKFVLVTLHRTENVDNSEFLDNFVYLLKNFNIPIVFPIHPRTLKNLQKIDSYNSLLNHDHIQMIQPVGYFDFLILMKNCFFIITDSGGIQEEATSPNIRKFVFILRKSTERPETIEKGFSKLIDINNRKVMDNLYDFKDANYILPLKSPFGDGNSGEKIVNYLKDIF